MLLPRNLVLRPCDVGLWETEDKNKKALVQFIHRGDFFIRRPGTAWAVRSVKVPFQVGQLLGALGSQCGGQM